MKTIFVKYSNHNHRLPKYSIITKFVKKDDGSIIVQKIPACPEAQQHVESIVKNGKIIAGIPGKKFDVIPAVMAGDSCVEMPFVQGISLQSLILEAILEKNMSEAGRLVNWYLEMLFSLPNDVVDCTNNGDFIQLFGDKTGSFHCLTEGHWDFIPQNILITPQNQAWNLDYEWFFSSPIPIEYILYRAADELIKMVERADRQLHDTIYEMFRVSEVKEIYCHWMKANIKYMYGEFLANQYVHPSYDYDRSLQHYAQEMDRNIEELNNIIKHRDGNIEELNNIIKHREGYIEDINDIIKHRDEHVEELNNIIKQRDEHIEQIGTQINHRDERIEQICDEMKLRDEHHIEQLGNEIKGRNKVIEQLSQDVKQMDELIQNLGNEKHALQENLDSIYSSRTWKFARISSKIFRIFTPTKK